ncbi:hypothetical protein [Rubrivirga marina]|uniref:Uncharacterized protein n=1 Tax=Rubrivirga marina TaxID=1196024 RepID=A0A271IVU0_9BACT|nr:hypothetical protein [Rubrivirga marina]PAP75333.1 hypothetical protein BSZ37_02170 [Rubrivirga marina]
MVRFAPLALVLLAAPALAQDAPTDARVEQALSQNNISYSAESNGDYRILFTLPGERSQLVWISPRTDTAGSLDVRRVFSYAAGMEEGQALSGGWAEQLLRNNAGYVVGSWSLTDNRVMFSTTVPADASDRVLLDTVALVMTTADGVEAELTGADEW